MDFTTISEHVLRIIQDEEGDRVSPEALLIAADEVHLNIGIELGIFRDSATLPVADKAPDFAFYALPSNFWQLRQVKVNGRPLNPMRLDQMPHNWEALGGAPTGYLLGPWGHDVLRLWPAPAADAQPLSYHDTCPESFALNPTPRLPRPLHMAIVYGTVAELYDTDDEARDPSKAEKYRQKYQVKLRQASSAAANGFDASPATVDVHMF